MKTNSYVLSILSNDNSILLSILQVKSKPVVSEKGRNLFQSVYSVPLQSRMPQKNELTAVYNLRVGKVHIVYIHVNLLLSRLPLL